MNYYKSGLYDRKLNEIYQYSKIKKELIDEQKKDNNTERSEENKTAA